MPARIDPTELLGYRDGIYASDLLLCAVAHLDLFSVLNRAPLTFEALCADLQIARRPADVMITLCLARGLLQKADLQYAPTDVARAYLVNGAPQSLVPYYASLGRRPECLEFLEVLRTDRPAGWSSKREGESWLDAMKDVSFADAFTSAMHSRGAYLATELAARLDCTACQALLDVGGASGIYACTLASANPHLAATVLEREPVDHAARRFLAAQGMSDRVTVSTGDMFATLPSGYDIHLFANVFHDWGLDSVQRLVAASFGALNARGVIAVFDAHLNEAKAGPLNVAEYSCLVMHATPGRCYSTSEIGEVLAAEGFASVAVQHVAAGRTLISATKS